MLLATGSSFDFMQFLQILCWILIPVFILASLLTIIMHYRKKKKEKAEMEDQEEKWLKATPELVGYTKGDGEFICFDHSPLIRDFKNKLTYNHARYTALRHDFDKLESRYQSLALYAIANFRNKKIPDMENNQEQMPRQMQVELDKLAAQLKAEKDELQAGLEQMNRSFKELEEENGSLQDQVSLQTASEGEQQSIFARWRDENKSLRDKVAEQQYLQDVLDEKKAQVDFLQNQLEQRIKSQHQGEQKRLQAEADLEEMKNVHLADIQKEEALKKELLLSQDEIDKLHTTICAKEEQLTEKQNQLSAKLEHLELLENGISETKEQVEQSNALLAEARETIARLEQDLNAEREKNRSLEQKSASEIQAMQKIFKEFSSLVSGEAEQSPVIALRPDYLERKDEEAVAQ